MKRENFNLESLKLRGDGGLDIDYSFRPEGGDVNDSVTRNSHIACSDDTLEPFETFKKAIYNFIGFNKIISEAVQLSKATKKWAIDKSEQLEELVSCYKITLIGKDDKQLIICTGKLFNGNSSAPINAPKQSVTNCWGVDVSDAVETLKDEAFKYLFEGKKAQLDLNAALDNGEADTDQDDQMDKFYNESGKKKGIVPNEEIP